jgi:glycosyltransferase involved in cell wall biosynthesis
MTHSIPRKIRILFLPSVDRDNTNAQSLNTREIALRLDPERFEVTLFYRTEADPRLLSQAHLRLRRLPGRGKTLTLFREMMAGHDLISYVDFSPASYMFVHVPRIFRRKTKAILHVESTGIRLKGETKLLSFLYAGILPNCDAYTAITEHVAHELAGLIEHPVPVLPVGVDTNAFTPPNGRGKDALTVLFAGTIVARKNPLDIIRAAKHFPSVRFRMIGPDRHGYSELVRNEISISGVTNVAFEGPKLPKELAHAMQESDIFLLPSRVEGLPKVTLEAAASALPCIVYRDYHTPSVVDGVTGFQVGTFEEMIEKLGLLISDRRMRAAMGIAARRHAQNFEWDKVAARWKRAFLDIAGRA